MAPEEVHTALRLGVIVLPGTGTLLCEEPRALVRADSRTKRPRADAMFDSDLTHQQPPAMRYVNCGMTVKR